MSTSTGKLVTAKTLSSIINLPVYTINQYRRLGSIPSYKIGKHILYDPDEVVTVIKRNKN